MLSPNSKAKGSSLTKASTHLTVSPNPLLLLLPDKEYVYLIENSIELFCIPIPAGEIKTKERFVISD